MAIDIALRKLCEQEKPPDIAPNTGKRKEKVAVGQVLFKSYEVQLIYIYVSSHVCLYDSEN